MKILIDITPSLNKWCKNEKEFLNLFKSTLQNELGKGDLDGTINNIVLLPKIMNKH
mgnify:CR=1 FL=1